MNVIMSHSRPIRLYIVATRVWLTWMSVTVAIRARRDTCSRDDSSWVEDTRVDRGQSCLKTLSSS